MDCFGPGIVAAFLGATLDNSSGQVWFHPPDQRPIQDIHFKFDPGNIWFRRIREIYQAGMERWQGQVLMGMTDMGGVMDILSTFRPSEQLLLDLYDEPEEVTRLLWEAHDAWHQYYRAINALLQPQNPGYSDWSRIYSDKPSYILQCDFSYMISPQMFLDFVRPELAASCAMLDRSIYHLDGQGALANLDALLTLPNLDGIQWVPGTGAPDCRHWPEVYRKISAAGKKMQVLQSDPAGFEILDQVIAQIGTARGIQYFNHGFEHVDRAGQTVLLNKLAAYGIA